MRAPLLMLLIASVSTAAPTRLKELASVQGQRENALIGYGLVVGLTNTGDSQQVLFTMQSVAGMLGRLGVRVDPSQVYMRDVAAVMVTAKLSTFARPGTTIDVTVSAMGDARSIAGGTLLMTPLAGPDGAVYALAQGPVEVGGFEAGVAGSMIRKNTPTSGRVPSGASVEKGVIPSLGKGPLVLVLKRPDFTNATRVATAISNKLGENTAKALDADAVEVNPPDSEPDRVALLSKLEQLEIDADVRARIVVSERTGTVVLGEKVRLRPAAVAHGGLKVTISQSLVVSQPPPLATSGRTVVAPLHRTDAEETSRQAVALPATATIDDLVKALNALGASSRDLVSILQALKAADALDADLEVI